MYFHMSAAISSKEPFSLFLVFHIKSAEKKINQVLITELLYLWIRFYMTLCIGSNLRDSK